jgi:renalase
MTASRARIAVIGAGMAGATCARELSDAGADVHVFEKSRGVGGRMATRRIRWRDTAQREHETAFDHGAPGFPVRSAAFAKFVDLHVESGDLVRWRPRMAPGSFVPCDGDECWTGSHRMPAVFSRQLDGLQVTLGCAVDTIRRGPGGWSLERLGQTLESGFAHVVLAMPPLQAATLLAAHRRDWATLARQQRMLPCWTLMGLSAEPAAAAWDVAWPVSGPLAGIVRNDRKPGRLSEGGTAHWVAHADARWSETHLEAPDNEVHAALLLSMDDFLGQRLEWRCSQVHRWRYASVARRESFAQEPFWYDHDLGLGVCGDYLGAAGVEGAWISGDALGERIARACGLLPRSLQPAGTIP